MAEPTHDADELNCPSQEEWGAFLGGFSEPGERQRLSKHLEQCRNCRDRLPTIPMQSDETTGVFLQPGGRNEFLDEPEFKLLKDRLRDAPLEAGSTGDHANPKLRQIGAFRIDAVIGRGGGGTVYRAFDTRTKRTVALKTPHSGTFLGKDRRRRFLWEAEATGQLDHPHIVPMYEAGDHDGTLYLVMAYCEGPTLAKWMSDRRQALSCDQAAQLIATLADAVYHAHLRGILHRDIKPSNVLLEPTPAGSLADKGQRYSPRLTDFGLAKPLWTSRPQVHTQTSAGAIVGTVAYMAPEQARGAIREIDTRTDVYALGVVLYELLTTHRPHQGDTMLETLKRIEREPPLPPSRHHRRIPKDIDTICLKCLEKSPAGRYQSAGELADELRRFVDRKPIRGRRAGVVERTLRWARRRPAVALLIALSLVTPLVIGGVIIERNRRLTDAFHALQDSRNSVQLQYYAANMRQAWHLWYISRPKPSRHHIALAASLDDPHAPDVRGFEWYYLREHTREYPVKNTLRGHTTPAYCVQFSPNEKILASGEQNGTIRLWNFPRHWDSPRFIEAHDRDVNKLAFNSDGSLLASCGDDGFVRLWNPVDCALLHEFEGHPGRVFELAFSPDNAYLYSAGDGELIRIWDVTRRALAATLPAKDVSALAVSPDGKHLVAAQRDTRLLCFDLVRQELIREAVVEHQHIILDLAFTPDGQLLLSACGDQYVREIDFPNMATARLAGRHTGGAQAVAMSPNGLYLASAGRDLPIRILNRGTQVNHVLRGNPGRVNGLSFSRDSNLLAAACQDGRVRVWQSGLELQQEEKWANLRCREGAAGEVALSPDGRSIATLTNEEAFKIVDLDSGATVGRFGTSRIAHKYTGICFTSDGRAVVTGHTERGLECWDIAKGKVLVTLPHPSPIGAMAVSPDSRLIAVGGLDYTVVVWDWRGERVIARRRLDKGVPISLAFSPAGSLLAIVSNGQPAHVLDLRTLEEGPPLIGHKSIVRHAAFSPDGTILATCSEDGTIKFWDPDSGKETVTLAGHDAQVWRICFSPDGRTLVSGDDLGGIRFWQTATGLELLNIERHHSQPIRYLAFRPDGQLMLSSAREVEERAEIYQWYAPR